MGSTITIRIPFIGGRTVYTNSLSQNMNDAVNEIYRDIRKAMNEQGILATQAKTPADLWTRQMNALAALDEAERTAR